MRQPETRCLAASELRVEPREGDQLPKIVGYAVVFNSLSEDLGGFREKVRPGTFTRSLKDDDVKALVNHNTSAVLGRTRTGTLRTTEDDHGIRIEIDPPNTSVGRDAVENVRRGDFPGMSFRFYVDPDGDEWSRDDAGPVRELRSARIDEVSLVTFPAYAATEAALRSLDAFNRSRSVPTPRRNHAERRIRLALAD